MTLGGTNPDSILKSNFVSCYCSVSHCPPFYCLISVVLSPIVSWLIDLQFHIQDSPSCSIRHVQISTCVTIVYVTSHNTLVTFSDQLWLAPSYCHTTCHTPCELHCTRMNLGPYLHSGILKSQLCSSFTLFLLCILFHSNLSRSIPRAKSSHFIYSGAHSHSSQLATQYSTSATD